ncbi:NADH/Ubiquinone/plastoquinone (complex I) [Ignisphaera aggregans DSM 17230]|uniref:NADH/Ubiquinone/plastoquinone (Complex I) n=1 Tax=Ignisphaera aggregans (strain DSM 17230 / JCM 13409 / AQ1.S1) TaxID=583356 RepID=E0SNV5_IGNAA|nr:NADH/Ubiquinone/plastoquinone (complex I) [Ignisphaera aggregans DSM 17230]
MSIDISLLISSIPILGIAIALAILLTSIVMRNRSIRTIIHVLFLVFLFLITIAIAIIFINLYNNPVSYYCFGGWPQPLGICYILDAYTTYFLFLVLVVFLPIALYSIWYSRHIDNYYYLYILIIIHICGLIALCLTSDFFNMYVMIEVIGISAYGLIAFYRYRVRALIASIRYAILGSLFTSLLFLSIAILYLSTGSLSIAVNGAILRNDNLGLAVSASLRSVDGVIIYIVIAIWIGLFISAIFPNHIWLPDAHSEAPTTVSALLSSLSVVTGIYIVSRIYYTLVYNSIVMDRISIINIILMVLGSISSILGSIMLIKEDDVKRIFAYSTIMNMGYIVLGIAITNPIGIKASLLHTLSHGIGKSMAFLSIGIFIWRYQTRNIFALEGRGYENPITTIFLTIALLNLIGLPPTAGFYSKLMLARAFLETRNYPVLGIFLATIVISAYGYSRVLEHLLKPLPPQYRTHEKEHLSPFVTSSLVTLSITIVLVVLLQPYIEQFLDIATQSLIHTYENYRYVLVEQLQNILIP